MLSPWRSLVGPLFLSGISSLAGFLFFDVHQTQALLHCADSLENKALVGRFLREYDYSKISQFDGLRWRFAEFVIGSAK